MGVGKPLPVLACSDIYPLAHRPTLAARITGGGSCFVGHPGKGDLAAEIKRNDRDKHTYVYIYVCMYVYDMYACVCRFSVARMVGFRQEWGCLVLQAKVSH